MAPGLPLTGVVLQGKPGDWSCRCGVNPLDSSAFSRKGKAQAHRVVSPRCVTRMCCRGKYTQPAATPRPVTRRARPINITWRAVLYVLVSWPSVVAMTAARLPSFKNGAAALTRCFVANGRNRKVVCTGLNQVLTFTPLL